jgi:hypothetical protein
MKISPLLKSGLPNEGLTLRQAALIAGFAYLLSPVTTAEFSIMPKLVIPGNIEQTVQNLSARSGHFVAAILCYLITFLEDVVIAWALYVLLAPVNKSLSLLTAWFRLIYTAVALVGWLNLVTVYRLLTRPDYLTLFGLFCCFPHAGQPLGHTFPAPCRVRVRLTSVLLDQRPFLLILRGHHHGHRAQDNGGGHNNRPECKPNDVRGSLLRLVGDSTCDN